MHMLADLLLEMQTPEDEQQLSDAVDKKLPRSVRRLVDEGLQYEIFPNGHSQFLTKKALQELREGMQNEAESNTFEPLPTATKKKTNAKIIPEPTDRYGQGKEIATLRLRAFPGNKLPDLFEGDFISGMFPLYARSDKQQLLHENTHEFLKQSGFQEFRILEIFWGFRSLVHSLVGSTAQKTSKHRSVSDTNAFVICEVVVR